MNPAALEPGYLPWDTSVGNRFAHYSPEDHSATLWIAAALGLTYVLFVVLIRIYIKWRVFGWDDGLIVASTILAVTQCVIVFGALGSGLGKVPENVDNIETVGTLASASRLIFIASHYLAKLSVLYLLRRLFVRDQDCQNRSSLLCNIVIGFITLNGVASMLTGTVQCPSSGFFVRHCDGQITRWSVITALDVASEGLTLSLPAYLVWKIQMKVETKLRVIAAFGFRLIVIVLSAIHLRAWIQYSTGPASPFTVVSTLILQQVLLTCSLICATIPNMKSFLQSLSANWGDAGFGSGYTSRAYGNGTFELNNVSNRHGSAPISRPDTVDLYSAKCRPNFQTKVATSRRVTVERASLGSGESRDQIIRKETAWTVEHS